MRRVPSAVGVAFTSLVGRSELVDEAQGLLHHARLITLAGPGGVGKTRVALELAHRAGVDYDAVAVVDLVELSAAEAGAAAVERALVSTLNIAGRAHQSAIEVLIEYLSSKRVLLVLDNCEHLWQAVGDVVSALMPEAPGLTVVATSRRHLDVAGEHVLQVPPLAIPSFGADRDQAALSDAVVLLLDRARAAGRPLADGDSWHDVVELVRWSGGLPLVLELVAIRLGGGLSPATIRHRLDGGHLLKAPGRRMLPHHRTLRQVLDWSYGLCSTGEQRLWARLSVFTGGFDLAMAEEVCGDPDGAVATHAVLDILTSLVRQSIVIADPNGRFRQLPPIREYGLQQLQAIGEEGTTRERHCAYLRRLLAEAAEDRCSAGELDVLRQLHRELPNIRAALTYCDTPQHAATGLRIATDVAHVGFTFISAFLDEISAWLDNFLFLTPPTASPDRVNALAMLALIRLWQGDQNRANTHRQECLDHARRLRTANGGADLPIATFLNGMYLFLAHCDPSCMEPLSRARDAFIAQDSRSAEFRARIWLAIAAGFLAPDHIAEQAAAESLVYAETHGGPWSKSWALWSQGRAAHAHPQVAMALLQQALRIMIDMRDQALGVNICIEAIAWECAAVGQALPAAQLLGAVSGFEQNSGVVIGGPGPFHRERERAISRIRTTLNDETYTEAFRHGHILSADDICALALSDLTASQKTTSQTPDLPLGALTTRQQQIAQLVAQGLSNKQIATKLHISQRTAENHLGQIFTRLGMHNRSQIAAWVTRQTSQTNAANVPG